MIVFHILLLCFLQVCCCSSETEHASLEALKSIKNPDDGGWGKWSPWSNIENCPVNCGTGYIQRSRVRKCDNPPPAANGNDCIGVALETNLTTCSSDECPGKDRNLNGSIFDWSPCLPVCGNGLQIRAKETCNPHHKDRCVDRRLHWEVRDCVKNCRHRGKRWLRKFRKLLGGGISTSTNSNGDSTWKANINTPFGSISTSLSHDRNGRVSGGSLGYSKKKGIASVGGRVGYSEDSGLSLGLNGGIGFGGYNAGGSASYNFGDRSATFGTSGQFGSATFGRSYNTRSGSSRSVGASWRGKRANNMHLLEDMVCEQYGESLLADPNDCGVYIVCHEGVAYVEMCPDGQSWDDDDKRCEDGIEENCID